MKPPYKENGMRYGFDRDGKRICTGAMMGRCDELPDNLNAAVKLHLRRVPFVDYCYDQGGAYWGAPGDLWCAWCDGVAIYTRAKSRSDAKAIVISKLPNARFYR